MREDFFPNGDPRPNLAIQFTSPKLYIKNYLEGTREEPFRKEYQSKHISNLLSGE